jgi:uncharacterized protein with PQ loop repeat
MWGHAMRNELITLANVMQLSVVGLSLLAYIPQWQKLIKTKSSSDISLSAWLLWTLSSVFAVFYAAVQLFAYDTGWALLVSALISLGFVAFTVVLIVRYRDKPNRPAVC